MTPVAPRNPNDPPISAETLSGMLNFIDGLWSSCGGEQIVVFTTNHVDKLDPALIRRGRMDMHIEMSYCGFEAFKTLVKNYLDIDAHPLFGAVEEQLRELNITPADVGECLMKTRGPGYGADAAMEFFLDELKKKREEAKAAAVKAAEPVPTAADAKVQTEDGQEIEYSDDDDEEEDDLFSL
jgi:SpoVK/Ycf46/Vps4 family AAA+-type ATPase